MWPGSYTLIAKIAKHAVDEFRNEIVQCQPEGRPSSSGTPVSRKVIIMTSPAPMDPSSLQIENPNILSLHGIEC